MMTYNVSNFAALKSALGSEETNIAIILEDSFELTSGFTIDGKSVTFSPRKNYNCRLTRAVGNTDTLFNVKSNASLLLKGVVIDGNKSKMGGKVSGPIIYNEGNVEIQDGTHLSENYGGLPYPELTTDLAGAGVNNSGSKAVFKMSGDSFILNNKAKVGGGVLNCKGARIYFSGAQIGLNKAEFGGGVANYDAEFNMTDGSVSYNEASVCGGGIYAAGMNGKSVSVTGGRIEENYSRTDGGGIFVPYQELDSIHIGAGAKFDGNHAQKSYERSSADDEMYERNIHGTKWTEPFKQGYNNADIAYTNDGCCNVQFPNICYSEPGVYKYTIREKSQSGNGWTADTKEYAAVVTVTDDGLGHLVASVHYPDGKPEFVNKYEATPVCVEFCAVKIAVGAPMYDGQFTFAMYDEQGHEIATAKNKSK
jgi:pilin isopeptide linkage protein